MQVLEVLFLTFSKIAQQNNTMLGKNAYIQMLLHHLYLGSTEQQNTTPQEKEIYHD